MIFRVRRRRHDLEVRIRRGLPVVDIHPRLLGRPLEETFTRAWEDVQRIEN